MTFRKVAVLAFCFMPLQVAHAQAAGNGNLPGFATPAGFDDLSSLFRISVTVFSPSGPVVDTYGLDIADDTQNFLDPAVLSQRFGQNYQNNFAVQGVVDIRGLPAFGSYTANSTALQIRVPAFDEPNRPYVLTFNGQTREDSYAQFAAYFDDQDSAEGQRLLRLLLRALARYSPIDPVAGNPGSIQGSLARSGLDLSSGDSAIEQSAATGANAKDLPGDPWMVGGSFTTFSAGDRYSGQRFDGRIQRSFRLAEGGRSLLKFDMPFSYSETNGARAASLQLGVGAEFTVIDRRWSLEPRVGYAITASDKLGSIGHMGTASVTSRFVIDGVGRGRIAIGNMVGYMSTISTAFTGYDFDPAIRNTVLRNGVAYELPVKARALGRSLSVRGSYAMTNLLGTKVYANTFHEATLSVGVRGREEGVRNARDLIRFSINGAKAADYKSLTFGVGFRF